MSKRGIGGIWVSWEELFAVIKCFIDLHMGLCIGAVRVGAWKGVQIQGFQ